VTTMKLYLLLTFNNLQDVRQPRKRRKSMVSTHNLVQESMKRKSNNHAKREDSNHSLQRSVHAVGAFNTAPGSCFVE
jgi:hypothetical protein